MPKYIYDNSPIYTGDVVEMQHDWSKFDQPIDRISIIQSIDIDGHPRIKDNRGEFSIYDKKYVKKIKTKPGDQSEIGDTIIYAIDNNISNSLIYQRIYTINKIEDNMWLYFKELNPYDPCLHSNSKILCTEKEKPISKQAFVIDKNQEHIYSGNIVEMTTDWSEFDLAKGDHTTVVAIKDNCVLLEDNRGSYSAYSVEYVKKVIYIKKRNAQNEPEKPIKNKDGTQKMNFKTTAEKVKETVAAAGNSMVQETLEVGKLTAGRIAYNNAKVILAPIMPKVKWYEKFFDKSNKRELTEMLIVYTALHMFRSKFDNVLVESVTKFINYELQNKFLGKIEGIVNIDDVFKMTKNKDK